MTTAVRSARRPQPTPSRASAIAWATADMVVRNPWRVLATVATLGCVSVVGVNALRQPAPHPAPLFASAKPAAPPVEPPRRPDFAAAAPAPAPAVVAPAAKPDVPAAPPKGEAARKPAGDPIGALLRSQETIARPADPKPAGNRIGTAQRALSKLGYGPIEPDGLLGTATRQALEKFERDRNLPVTGGLGPKTTRQLAAASGLPIE